MESSGKYLVICMVSLAAAVMNMGVCSAMQHVVGEDRGWDPSHSDFQGWASQKIFRVGDNLWFAYSSGHDNVLELKSQEDLEKCDLRNPLKLYDGGLDAVALVRPGSRYFSSGREENCRNGMKLHINVISDGMDDESDNYDVVSDNMENYGTADHDDSNLVSDGMETEPGNVKLVSDGMENATDDRDLVSDGMDNGFLHGLESSSSILSSAVNYLRMGRMVAAEGPAIAVTSGARTVPPSAYSILIIFFSFLVTTLYVVI